MELKIFKWHEMTTEQKADLSICNIIFLLAFTIALALFVFGSTFDMGVLMIAGFIVFVGGVFMSYRYLKKAGGAKIIEDLPVTPKEILTRMSERRKINEERRKKGEKGIFLKNLGGTIDKLSEKIEEKDEEEEEKARFIKTQEEMQD